MKEAIYDAVLNTLYINLYTLSKKDKYIKLKNFDPNNKSHLLILKISSVVGLINQKTILVDCSIITKFKMYLKGNRINFQCKKNLEVEKDCYQIIEDIEKYYTIGLFNEIYEEYYNGEK